MTKPNETIPYVTRNLRHLLAAPNLTELQRTIITRTLATLSELSSAEAQSERPSIDDMFADAELMRAVAETSRKVGHPTAPTYVRSGTGIMHRNTDETLRKSIEHIRIHDNIPVDKHGKEIR